MSIIIDVAQSLLHLVACLAPFIPNDLLEQLSYTVAFSLTTFPSEVHDDIMTCLCNTLLPLSLGN